jgi:hypothetical protein
MIVDSGEDKRGKFYKLGMIERLSLTLENYASSKFGNLFYSESFLRGLCERRNEIHSQTSKATGGLVISTTVLAFFDSIEGTTTVWGLTFSIPEIGALALCVLVSVNLLALTLSMIDQLIIDRFLNTLGNRLGIYSFELTLLQYSAKNLWTMAVMPKYFGLASQIGHKSVQGFLAIFYLVVSVAFLAFPVSVVLSQILRRPIDHLSNVEVVLAVISLFIMISTFLLMIAFCFSYKFRPTGSSEPADPIIPEYLLDLGNPVRSEQGEGKPKDTAKVET